MHLLHCSEVHFQDLKLVFTDQVKQQMITSIKTEMDPFLQRVQRGEQIKMIGLALTPCQRTLRCLPDAFEFSVRMASTQLVGLGRAEFPLRNALLTAVLKQMQPFLDKANDLRTQSINHLVKVVSATMLDILDKTFHDRRGA